MELTDSEKKKLDDCIADFVKKNSHKPDFENLLFHKENELLYDIKIDRIFAPQYEYMKTLDRSIKKSISEYQGTEYGKINRTLREKIQNPGSFYVKHIKNLDKAFSDVPPLTETVVLYRGQKDEPINSDSYTSTSSDKSVALRFTTADCCLYRITILPGTRVLPLRNRSSLISSEFEYLIERGNPIKVTNLTKQEIATSEGTKEINVMDVFIEPRNSVPIEIFTPTEPSFTLSEKPSFTLSEKPSFTLI